MYCKMGDKALQPAISEQSLLPQPLCHHTFNKITGNEEDAAQEQLGLGLRLVLRSYIDSFSRSA